MTRYLIEKLLDLAAGLGLLALIWIVVALLFGFDPLSP